MRLIWRLKINLAEARDLITFTILLGCFSKPPNPHEPPNRHKMWDNFAKLTVRLAKSRVLFNNLTIYLDFSAIFSQIVPNRPLNEGRHLGATFCRRGATFWLGLQRYATVLCI